MGPVRREGVVFDTYGYVRLNACYLCETNFWTYVTYGQSTENRTIMINGGPSGSPKYALDWLSVDWNISIRYGAKVQ